MKKLKLNKANFAGAEVLSREQLKKIMGGRNEESSTCPDGEFVCASTTDSGTVSRCASSIEDCLSAS